MLVPSRWAGHEKKALVEECLYIDVRDLSERNVVPHSRERPPWLHEFAARRWRANGHQMLRISYCASSDKGQERIEEDVGLTSTRTGFGQRRWFVCPGCHRRGAMLYLRHGSALFRCRNCCDLTYRCRQQKGRHSTVARQSYRRLRTALKLTPEIQREIDQQVTLRAIATLGLSASECLQRHLCVSTGRSAGG